MLLAELIEIIRLHRRSEAQLPGIVGRVRGSIREGLPKLAVEVFGEIHLNAWHRGGGAP